MIALKQGGRTLLELPWELSELVLQIGEVLLQSADLAAKCGGFFFEMRHPFFPDRIRACACFRFCFWLERLNVTGQEVRVARFFGAGLARENFDELRLPVHQIVETV